MPMSATVQHLSPRGKLMLCAYCTDELHFLQLSNAVTVVTVLNMLY